MKFDFEKFGSTVVIGTRMMKKDSFLLCKRLSEFGLDVYDINMYTDHFDDPETKSQLIVLGSRKIMESDLVIVIEDKFYHPGGELDESLVSYTAYAKSLGKPIIFNNGVQLSDEPINDPIMRDIQTILKADLKYSDTLYDEYVLSLRHCPHCGHISGGINRKNVILRQGVDQKLQLTEVEMECLECKERWTVPYDKGQWEKIKQKMVTVKLPESGTIYLYNY